MKTLKMASLRTVSPVLVLTIITLACLVPFIGKPFHMDDPLFVWCAKHLQSNPVDFYGFNINWQGQQESMAVVTQNPPLACYYLALVGFLFGWSEVALHAGFLLPAVGVVIGTYYLARNFCSHPSWAALVTALSPVFLVSSTSVMCDTMMLAFWVWSVFFWMEGLKTGDPAKMGLAVFLITLCGLTKYFGLSLIPLLLAYSLWERRRVGWWLLYLCLPIVALAFYQWWTFHLYGHGLLWNAVSYATTHRVGGELLSKILAGFAFLGGCMFILLAAAPLLWSKRSLVAAIPVMIMIGLLVLTLKTVGEFHVIADGSVKWFFVVQFSLLVVAGMSLVFLAAMDLLGGKTSASVLLFLWVAGTFVFTCLVNWTVSGRNILPMLPAVSVLLIRRLESRDSFCHPNGIRHPAWPLGASLVIALLAATADYQYANSARLAASHVKQELEDLGANSTNIWFEGHWGFQYYMEQLGGTAIDRFGSRFAHNDVIVVPLDNTHLIALPAQHVEPKFQYESEAPKWLTTMNSASGAGYYSDSWGPLPYVFCRVPASEYIVLRVK